MQKNLEYTCIFGGGAIRGIAYIGALRALDELNVKLTTLVGSSVGAIIAGLLAVGYTTDEIEDIFMGVNFELFKDIQFGKGFGISKGEIFLEWIKELLEKKYYGYEYKKGKNAPVKFSDLKKNLVIITTNLAGFCCKEFSNFKTPDAEVAYAIRISSSMPGLMPPVKASGAVLVDGDLQKSWPLWKLVPELCEQKERILEFRLEGDFDEEKHRNIDFVNTVYSCVTSVATKFIVDKYGQKDKFDYLILNTGATIIVDFNINEEKRDELVKLGYEQTINYFKNTLKQKKEKLLECYIPMSLAVRDLIKLISEKKFFDAKCRFGEFYMKHIQSVSKFVELDFISELDAVKNMFLENYSQLSVFKITKLKNHKVLIHKLNKLLSELEETISELQNYSFS